QEIHVTEARAPADHRRLGQKAQERHEADALPTARLADDAQHLALAERERETVDGVDGAVVRLEADREVLHLQQRRAHRVVLGSRMSRSPSPSRLNDSEQKKMARPG